MSTIGHRTNDKWGRGRRGPTIEILTEAACRAGAEEFQLGWNVTERLVDPTSERFALLAVLDGPTPSYLVITLGDQ